MRAIVVAVLLTALVGCTSSAPDTDDQTARAQESLARAVPAPVVHRGQIPKARAVTPGKAMATIEIPRLGDDWKWVIVEGTHPEHLAQGIGHFLGTALPGQRGNTAYAGHRNGWGSPLLDFETLRAGDEIVLAQGRARWTYRVTVEPTRIEPTEVWVLGVPGPGRWLTLTTCWPKYGNEKRMYLRARLVRPKGER